MWRRHGRCGCGPADGRGSGGDDVHRSALERRHWPGLEPAAPAHPGLRNDDLSAADFATFLAGFASLAVPLVDGDVHCILGASEWPALDLALRGAGLHCPATIIWVKDAFVLGRSKYHRRYEPLWYGWRDLSSFAAGRKPR